jgi:hypothetical protein
MKESPDNKKLDFRRAFHKSKFFPVGFHYIIFREATHLLTERISLSD